MTNTPEPITTDQMKVLAQAGVILARQFQNGVKPGLRAIGKAAAGELVKWAQWRTGGAIMVGHLDGGVLRRAAAASSKPVRAAMADVAARRPGA